MISTMKQKKKQISDLKMDLEVINPIESKTVLGGDWYNTWWDNGDGMTIVFGNDGGSGGFNWDPYGNSNDPGSWDHGDGSSGGGGGNNDLSPADYPGGVSLVEAVWLSAHPQYLPDMIHNKELAEQYGQGQHNGVYDALRHALWSALDVADLGYEDAEEFHTLHETDGLHPWDPIESPSDINNNDWGYVWAMNNGDPENNINQFISDFNVAVQNGDISVIH
jgi:hypothetical protein